MFFTSDIQEPAFGNKLSDVENVPITRSGILIPKPNVKRRKKPHNKLFIFVTIVRTKISAGDTHGDATVPLISPKTKAEIKDPEYILFFFCMNLGI